MSVASMYSHARSRLNATHDRQPQRQWSRTTAICAFLGLVIAGCDNAAPRAGANRIPTDTLIVIIGPSPGDSRSAALATAFQRFFAVIDGVRVSVITPRSDSSDDLREATERAIRSKPRAVAVYAADGDELDAAVRRLASSCSPIVTIGGACREPQTYAQVRYDDDRGAELLAKEVDRILRDDNGYLLVHDRSRGGASARAFATFDATSKHHSSKIRFDDIDLGPSRTTPAQNPLELMRDALARFRSATLLVCLEPSTWLRVDEEVFSQFIAINPRIQFATVSTSSDLWRALAEGRAAALAGPNDAEIGRAAASLIYRGLTGGTSPEPTFIEPHFITAQNLAEFRADVDRELGQSPVPAPSRR